MIGSPSSQSVADQWHPALRPGPLRRTVPEPVREPPGVGESSPLVNVYWGFANLAGGAALVMRFAPQDCLGWAALSAGSLLMGTQAAIHFGKVRANTARAAVVP